MFEHEFGGLEAGGQILMSRFLDDTGAGEADHALWLGDIDIADGGKGCGHSAGCGVGEDGNIRKLCFGVEGKSASGFGHLHEGEHAFLHAGA